MKRGSSGLCGILAIDKPYGVTSHDVVDCVRRITGERRVGHAGTLDPAATGLILVAVGAATRLSAYLTGHDKSYRARIVFGVATDTDDAQGRVIEQFSNSAPGQGTDVLEALDAKETIAGLVGTYDQLPPAYSAIKRGGVTAYKAAREGHALELDTRRITVHEAVLAGSGTCDVDLDDGQDGRCQAVLPYWDVDLSVSKGTYIRSIARDLGQQLGCGAHLGSLRRISVGVCSLADASTVEQLVELKETQCEFPWCDPVELLGFTRLDLNQEQAASVLNGRSLDAHDEAGLVACVYGNRLLAVYERQDAQLKPAAVIPGGVCGVA